MSGISEALVATAVGLLVAIPAVVGFNFYNRRVRTLAAQVETVAQTILAALRAEAIEEAKEAKAAGRTEPGSDKKAPDKAPDKISDKKADKKLPDAEDAR
jgi:hypothetical protein